MTRHAPHIRRRRIALVLLAVFVWGGLLGPALHRAAHGLTWADLRGTASTETADLCDHDAHPERFEVTVPALHEDLCPVCTRHFVSLDGLDAPRLALQRVGATVLLSTASAPSRTPSAHPIRGPPHSA